MDEDLDPRQKKKTLKNLDNYSIDELKDYIQMLQAEIVRAQEQIDKKASHMSAAAMLFKKSGD